MLQDSGTSENGRVANQNAIVIKQKADRRQSRRFTITDRDIARRAFELYCARGCRHGHDLDDWLEAERELRANALSNLVPQQW
jgi:hypothetical protein